VHGLCYLLVTVFLAWPLPQFATMMSTGPATSVQIVLCAVVAVAIGAGAPLPGAYAYLPVPHQATFSPLNVL
jgi:hypothetical protein